MFVVHATRSSSLFALLEARNAGDLRHPYPPPPSCLSLWCWVTVILCYLAFFSGFGDMERTCQSSSLAGLELGWPSRGDLCSRDCGGRGLFVLRCCSRLRRGCGEHLPPTHTPLVNYHLLSWRLVGTAATAAALARGCGTYSQRVRFSHTIIDFYCRCW